ncbi:MAG: coproporphyrinogen dehydrogenase HemZ [Christensenellales bacterium]
MIRLTVSNEEYLNDLAELVRPFESRSDKDVSIDVDYLNDGRNIRICIKSDAFDGFEKHYAFPVVAKDELERKRIEKRHLKVAIYRTLSFITGVNLPYGCLTGIRPTKLFLEIENEFEKYGKSACEVFEDDYSVSENKVKLVKRIVDVQRPLRNKSQNEYDVFVFIPFCPTRCAYCSFVSLPIDKQIKLVRPYVDCLLRELEQTKELIRSRKIKVRAVYVGGGTPTSIGAELLDEVLAACHFGASEFTVEAGRPDTIDKDVASVLKKHGVTRVSVNPQTFNDKTLEVIGRRHKCADTYNAYMLVKDDFDVNMDLIACLPGETFDDFKRSVDIAVALNPANVTVHTLYMKKGSALKQCGYDNTDYDTASRMVDYAYSRLTQAGYEPYYMYRQKYTSGNLENVGYAKPGKACLYNVDIMEEDTSILANGANGISKKWDKDKNLITRCANYKEPLEYVKHIDEMLKRQRDFWN